MLRCECEGLWVDYTGVQVNVGFLISIFCAFTEIDEKNKVFMIFPFCINKS